MEEIDRIKVLKKFKINYMSSDIIIYSGCSKEAVEKEIKMLDKWLDKITNLEIPISQTTKQMLTDIMKAPQPKSSGPEKRRVENKCHQEAVPTRKWPTTTKGTTHPPAIKEWQTHQPA